MTSTPKEREPKKRDQKQEQAEKPRQTFLGENAFAHFAEREFSEDTAREIDCAVR